MKAFKTIALVLSLSVMVHFTSAQTSCQGNKVRMSKGSNKCGCHCQKKCVAPGDVQSYLNNGWYYGDCFGSCCWIRMAENTSATVSALTEVYPNPASGSVTIAFTLSQPGEVILDVFDMTGRFVAAIEQDRFEAGGFEVTWDTGNLTPGLYYIRMRTGGFNATKQIAVTD